VESQLGTKGTAGDRYRPPKWEEVFPTVFPQTPGLQAVTHRVAIEELPGESPYPYGIQFLVPCLPPRR